MDAQMKAKLDQNAAMLRDALSGYEDVDLSDPACKATVRAVAEFLALCLLKSTWQGNPPEKTLGAIRGFVMCALTVTEGV